MDFILGNIVMHKTHGVGRYLTTEKDGETAAVQFEKINQADKTLFVKISDLKIISDKE